MIFVLALLIAAAAAGYTGVLASQFVSDFLSALVAAALFVRCFGGRKENRELKTEDA